MERSNKKVENKKEKLEKELQEKYFRFVLVRWKECVEKGLQTRLIINFDNGKVTSIQDQAIIAGMSVIDIYSDKVVSSEN